MMTNLFSIFDPSTSLKMSLNWMCISLPLLFLMFTNQPWIMSNKTLIFINFLNSSLAKELKATLMKNMNYSFLLFLSIFFLIFLNNFMSLFPYIFSTSSHMLLSLSLAFPLWLSFLMYISTMKTNNLFSHLIPTSTPTILMMFMVMVETISLIIRPMTLSIRLMANMTAGHLILSLISSQLPKLSMLSMSMLIAQLILMLLEMAVSFIQAYVFMILLSLYMSEIK